MSTGVIYMYTAPNGKKYIGQTWNEQKRRWDHRSVAGKDSLFHRAIRKYGKDSFEYEILYSGIDTQEQLNKLESQSIAEFNTIAPHGYNLTTGGEGGKHHEQSKQKMRDRWVKDRDKIIEGFKKAAARPETRARLIQNAINNGKNSELLKRRGEALKKAFSSEEVRAKRSQQRAEEWKNPEIRKKRLENSAIARDSEEYKQRQIDLMKERWKSEEYRAHMHKKMKGKTRSPEASEKTAQKKRVKIICNETGIVFDSVISASKQLGISHSCISCALTGKQKTAAGFTWSYFKNDSKT